MVKDTIDVIIEVPKGSGQKYEIDFNMKKGPTLRLDRLLTSSMSYPGNYGYIPNTTSEDGDPLDALLLIPYPLHPGCVVECRPIGVLIMTDEKGLDEKILVLPANSVDQTFKDIDDISQMPKTIVDSIEHFFTYYKIKEENKWSKVDGIRDKNEAIRLINKYRLE